MAGIGFSLEKILRKDTLTRTISAYGFAGLMSGGPWLLAILSFIFFALFIPMMPHEKTAFSIFLTSFAWMIVGGLIISGAIGQAFSRFIADQLFLNHPTKVVSNLNGLVLIVTILSGSIAFFVTLFFFQNENLLYRMLLIGAFSVLTNVLVVVMLLTAIKDYKQILIMFLAAYCMIIFLGYFFRKTGLNGFLFSFLMGQITLLLTMLIELYREYPTNYVIAFDFLKKGALYSILIITGFLLNLGIWIDKLIFWFAPSTSYQVIGLFRGSEFYDIPVFISYFCILPGFATFLLLMETKFAQYYETFNNAIRYGKSLSYIRIIGDQMVTYAYNVIHSMIKIQALMIIGIYLLGRVILTALKIPDIYYNILYVMVMGSSFQAILFSVCNLLYYMDRRWFVFVLSITYFLSNLILTTITIYLEPFYYGYGYALAGALSCALGLYFLNDEFSELEYKAIMLRED